MSSAFLITSRSNAYYLSHFAHGFGHGRDGASILPIAFAVDWMILHGCPHVGHGFFSAHGAHGFGHGKLGASMLVTTSAVFCIMLLGCPHVAHGFFSAHGAHGFGHAQPANAGTANVTATATANANTANFFIPASFVA